MTDDEAYEHRERASMEEDLQHERDLTARTASADRVRAVVREAVYAELTKRGYRGALGNQLAVILAAVADRVAAQLTAPDVLIPVPPDVAVSHAITPAEVTKALQAGARDRAAAEHRPPPPGHVCPVPYGLGPDDLDILEDLADMVVRDGLATDPAAPTRTRAVLIRILAAHRAPVLPPANDDDPDHFIA